MAKVESLLKNTVTNYLLAAVRIVEGILLTRWTYHQLGNEYYGFYSLLWTIFFYSLLFDFGFSRVAQKYTAERLFERTPKFYNDVISAVFSLHLAVSLIIVAGTVIAGHYLHFFTRVSSPEELSYCRQALYLFGFITALTFPTGIFPELLVGLQKHYLRNYILLITRVVELVGVAIIIWCGGMLLPFIAFTVFLGFATNGIMAVFCFRLLPRLKIRLYLSRKVIREIADFSGCAYLIMVSNMVLLKTDRLLLSIFSGLDSVGFYQLGSRIPDMLQNLTGQYQESISPVSAALKTDEDQSLLRHVLLNGMRFCSFLATGGTLGAALFAPLLLKVLFNVEDPEVILACRWLLLSCYITVAFRSIAGRFLLMSGRHRLLLLLHGSEAIANLALSIWWIQRFGLLGVIWGTLVPNAIIGIGVILPYMVRFLRAGTWKLLRNVYLYPALSCIPVLLLFLGFSRWSMAQSLPAWLQLIAGGAIAALLYFVGCAILMLTKKEKSFILSKYLQMGGKYNGNQ